MIDHYRTLGVAATADEAVIRAVYVTLMKRFHPDRSADPETLMRAQAINEAYAVLSDPERRAAYDDERAGLHPWERGAILPPKRRSSGAGLAALTALGLGAAALIYVAWPTLSENDRRRSASAPIASTPTRCAALADPERIRTALIVRLDQAGALDAASAGALTAARFELGPPTDARDLAAPGEVACLATLAITLPPAFRTAAGQGTILSELQYSVSRTDPELGVAVQPDGRLVAALSAIRHQPAKAVTNPMLEADARLDEAMMMPPPTAVPGEPKTVRPPAIPEPRKARLAAVSPVERIAPPPRTPRPAPAVRTASTGEGLAGVDRLTMNFYAQSLRHADGDKRGKLARTHGAFSARLAACDSDPCRRSAYLARNAEISRIMMGE
ncbi:MAG TPA: J domain-containing protein [Sphingomicrobium sp.]|nr:J domain-containing protein [Sphingomicrobium sp.]